MTNGPLCNDPWGGKAVPNLVGEHLVDVDVGGQNIAQWLEPQLLGLRLTGLAHDLCKRLLAANIATWAEELGDIALHAIEQADPKPGSSETKVRWLYVRSQVRPRQRADAA